MESNGLGYQTFNSITFKAKIPTYILLSPLQMKILALLALAVSLSSAGFVPIIRDKKKAPSLAEEIFDRPLFPPPLTRQTKPTPTPGSSLITAREAIDKSDLLDVNAFYRGSPEPADKIFAEGFFAPGLSFNITAHLLFSANSSFVSITADRNHAKNHAFNQTSVAGFIYRIKPSIGIDGVWAPGWKRGDPSANRNQELAVVNYVPGWLIHGAWVFHKSNRGKVEYLQNPLYEGGPWLENQEQGDCTEGEAGCGEEAEDGSDIDDDRSAQPLVPADTFLGWVNSTEAETKPGFFDSLLAGEITYQDCILAFKKAFSVALTKRLDGLSGSGSAEETVGALMKTIGDILTFTGLRVKPKLKLRPKTKPGSAKTYDLGETSSVEDFIPDFITDILAEIGPVARQIHEAKTPDEKLAIANEDIHPLVVEWASTIVGRQLEVMMLNVAHEVPFGTAVVLHLANVWSYTPFGWIVNQIYPIDDLLRRGIRGQEKSVDYAIKEMENPSPGSVGHTMIRIG
ncbi:hypothetical protein L249_4655 [Ophiocordyceps polyrhachis-furcata BCC 54312]|uniref:Heat-labile enterotoxin n=1 Tax=Ophiocordyceps polyrhachis-furcata BCC 54312 TaxID=1330021 RepID=A0A367L3L4_9HYPO|nr:hypothetical protein L249_4655 [Ophiocordyceps polyrhachis-furcata BCC 54312]